MKLHKLILNSDGSINWQKSWKKALPLNYYNFKEANLRELYKNEIILDYEEKHIGSFYIKFFIKNNYNFRAYVTGSRGMHLHFIFDDLLKLNDMLLIKYRELFIKTHYADVSKKSGFIAIENRKHFKTGFVKKLICENKTFVPNRINKNILYEASRLLSIENEYTYNKFQVGNYSILDIAKKLGFVLVGKIDKEYFGYIEKSERKKHFWINIEKNCFFDFHTSNGGGVISLIKRIKNYNDEEAINYLRLLK